MTTERIHVGLVEDQLLFRQGIKSIIDKWPGIDVVFESGDGYSVIEKLSTAQILPQVMLVDLTLPPKGNQEFNGEMLVDALRESYPQIKIIILSVHANESFIARLIERGANGYLVKDSDPQEVKEAILSVYLKGSYINERALRAIQNNLGRKHKDQPIAPQLLLTRREEEVLNLICQQFTTEEIAEKLFISVKTVNGHRNNLLQKTASRNMAGLVVFALRHNVVRLFE